MFPARVVVLFYGVAGDVWCGVLFRDAQYIAENQYHLALWFAVLGLINFPFYGVFRVVAGWSIDMCLRIRLGYECEW
jgi:hypothetical protein